MEKQNIIILRIFLIVLGIGIGYLLSEADICKTEQIRNESFNDGFIQGVSYWNNFIISTVNNNNEIPYITNNTIQKFPINQRCQG